jgi:hypothetical protein
MRLAVPHLLCLLLCAPLAAQEHTPDSVEELQIERVPSPANPGAVLFSRDRELMHPGDPLVVVGMEQGGNGFRQRAPALLHSDREPLLVDAEENHRRRIAMYEDSASFQRGLPTADGVARRTHEPPARRSVAKPVEPAPEDGGFSTWVWLPALVVFGLLMGFWARQRSASGAAR